MFKRIIIGGTVSVCAAVVLAACGDSNVQPSSPDSGGLGTGSADRARPTQPTKTSEHPPPGQCREDAYLMVNPSHPPTPICLRVGHSVRLSTTASPHQPWESPTSSEPSVVKCESTHVGDGAVHATCTGLKPGIAVISTQTMPFQGDPHGPAQQMWQLTVTVTN